jgi:hypothetical protein
MRCSISDDIGYYGRHQSMVPKAVLPLPCAIIRRGFKIGQV